MDHWINQPLAGELPQPLLLQLAVQQPDVTFTQLLVRAGARADTYSDDFGQVGGIGSIVTSKNVADKYF